MKIDRNIAREIFFEEVDVDIYKHIETSSFVRNGKYEQAYCIINCNGLYYRFIVHRTGSPYTEYYYNWEYEDLKCEPVKLVEVVKKEWHTV